MVSPKKILYPINLDSENIIILNRIFIMAKDENASVAILYVNDQQAGYRHPHKTEEDVQNVVAKNSSSELLKGIDVTYHVAQGNLGSEVKDFCIKEAIDLIVTGHKQHNRLYTSLFDSPEESILDLAEVPVLIIPKKIAKEESKLVDG